MGENMLFWLIVGALALGVTALLVLALLRGAQAAQPAVEFDLKVYKDQLAEVDRDAARGVVSPEDAERARTEISRRILAADSAAQTASTGATGPTALRTGAAAVMGLALIGGSLWLYGDLGAPGYGDLALKDRIKNAEIARATRPSQEEAEASLPAPLQDPNAPADYVKLVQQLRDAVAQRPNDLQGAQLLARHEMALGQARAAYIAQQQVLRLRGSDASAEDFANYADMLVIAAGGYVSPEAEGALKAALDKDRANGVARYYYGLMMSQVGRPDIAFRTWQALLRDGPADAAWVPPVREQIEEMAFRAGADYTLPELETAPGPSAADVAAAQDMSEEDRQQMIQGMVARLSDRLATEGGTPEEWARLIRALSVLGDADRILLIWNDAKEVFAGNPDAMAVVRQAARDVGLPE